jgi:hypothetical protein
VRCEDYVCPKLHMRINASCGEECFMGRDHNSKTECPECPRRGCAAAKALSSVDALEKLLKELK